MAFQKELGHEMPATAWRWIHLPGCARSGLSVSICNAHIRDIPASWYSEEAAGFGIPGAIRPNTAGIAADEGSFVYDSDYYGDDLPSGLAPSGQQGEFA